MSFVSIHRGGGDASTAGTEVTDSKQAKPSSAIEQAMQATLASIELPPPPTVAQAAQPDKPLTSESRYTIIIMPRSIQAPAKGD